MRTFFPKALLLLSIAGAACAANADGVWKIRYKGANGMRESTLTLKVDGDNVTGTLSGERGTAKIDEGKVNGDNITFTLIRRGNSDEIPVHYTGKIEGDTMKLQMEYRQRTPVEITGKRGS
jgi:hypothetical protein